MNILVACEFSGIVRDTFRARGHNAISCDLEPSERPGPHYQGDVRDLLHDGWDAAICHPPCTYLAKSGVRWLYEEAGRWEKMREAVEFFKLLLDAPIPRIAIENPVLHRYAIEIIGRKPDQIFQPWQFGHGETKATCLWLKGLPPLFSTEIAPGNRPRIHYMAPGPDRGKERSRTYAGIAQAMADQWLDAIGAEREVAS